MPNWKIGLLVLGLITLLLVLFLVIFPLLGFYDLASSTEKQNKGDTKTPMVNQTVQLKANPEEVGDGTIINHMLENTSLDPGLFESIMVSDKNEDDADFNQEADEEFLKYKTTSDEVKASDGFVTDKGYSTKYNSVQDDSHGPRSDKSDDIYVGFKNRSIGELGSNNHSVYGGPVNYGTLGSAEGIFPEGLISSRKGRPNGRRDRMRGYKTIYDDAFTGPLDRNESYMQNRMSRST